MVSLNLPALQVPPLNAHYEGEYDEQMLRWREVCAKDKVSNIVSLLDANNAGRPEKVLEAGCGTAVVLLEMWRQRIGSFHHGADVADPADHPHPGVVEAGLELAVSDGVRLPYDDDSFDLVFASHVLEHVPDERGFLSELKRVSRRWVYVEVPCEIVVRTSIGKLQSTLNIGHINSYTPETVALTLATAGLVPCDVQLFDHSMEVHAFHNSAARARIKAAVRRGLLKTNPTLASRLFAYHCGALVDLQAPQNLN